MFGRRRREKTRSKGEGLSVMGAVAEAAGDVLGAVADVGGSAIETGGSALEHAGGCAEGCAGCVPVVVIALIPLGWLAATAIGRLA